MARPVNLGLRTFFPLPMSMFGALERLDLRELPPRPFARHPWEIVRADFFARLLRGRIKDHSLAALDMGAGDGYLAQRLLTDFPALARLTCFDLAYDSAWLETKAAAGPRLRFTATKPDGRFDLVLMLDVLEHLQNDQAALIDVVARHLSPGAWLLLSVPAGERLYSRHDAQLGHHRRYSPRRLRALVQEAGLTIVDRGELFASLIVPRAAMRIAELALGRDPQATPEPSNGAHIATALGTWKHGPIMTSAITAALSLDTLCSRMASTLRLPYAGLSTWVLAQRR